MTKLAFSVAAMLLASSAAFAGGNYASDNANRPAVDTNATASIPYTAHQDGVDTKVTTGPNQGSVQGSISQQTRDSIWGR